MLHVGEGALAERLLEEQAHQRSFEALVSQLPQGLQDAGDPKVVVLGPEKERWREDSHVASGKSWNRFRITALLNG